MDPSDLLPCTSLWEPWASAIALGVKTMETRSWAPPRKLIGATIGIAAAKRKTKPDELIALFGPDDVAGGPFDRFVEAGIIRPEGDRFPLGCIVATATLAAVYPMVSSGGVEVERAVRPILVVDGGHPPEPVTIWTRDGHREVPAVEVRWGLYAPGRFAWQLTDVALLPQGPVPARGAQGFWTFPTEQLR